MKNITLFACCIFVSSFAIAQQPANQAGGNRNMNVGHFYGKVVDAKTGKGIPGVTVQLVRPAHGGQTQRFDTTKKFGEGLNDSLHKFDSTRRFDSSFQRLNNEGINSDTTNHKPTASQSRATIVATVITQSNGDFSLENIPVFGTFTIHLSAVGYTDYTQQVSFGLKFQRGNNNANNNGDQQNRMQQMVGMIDKDLGNIKLTPSETTLAGVTVTAAAKPFFEMGVDRKVFNVDKNLVTTGQTATEVMKQIPTVNVDIDGNVTVRNATPQLFVDGRPTTLTLDQIPADLIDKVELITNPSAKYDASGGNAGILNIILKKNIKKGYNGGIRAGVDTRGKINTGGDINYRQGKLNFFLSGVYNQRKTKYSSLTDKTNVFDDTTSYVHVDEDGVNEGYFSFIRGGFDYFIDNRNTLSLSANYNRGQFNGTSAQSIDSTSNNGFISNSERTTNSDFHFHNVGGMLSFKHNFAKNGHDWTADVNYNSSNNDNNSTYITNTYNSGNQLKYPQFEQRNYGSGENRFLTIQSDYENTITENKKIEAGVRAAIRNYKNLNDQYFYNDSLKDFILFPSISTNYKYTDEVYAAYGTYTLKAKKWNYELGLRAESSNYKGTSLTNDTTFKINYPISLFPSAFITYKLADKQDIQINYSRRINRPNFFQLIPIANFSNLINPSIGNPALKPEFTNSFELSYDKAYAKNSNFLATAYFKYATDLITNVLKYIPVGDNPTGKDTVLFNTYANANNSITYGLELTNRLTIAKVWDMTLNVNFYNAKINGTNIEPGLTNERLSWFGKWNNNIKFGKGFNFQLSGNYQSKTVLPQGGGGGGRGGFFGPGNLGTAQGYQYPFYSFDAALRKDWQWKGGNTLSLTLSMNDIFRTAESKTYSETSTDYFTQTQLTSRRRDPQILRINLSYRFGKFDATLFKRKDTRGEQNTTPDANIPQ